MNGTNPNPQGERLHEPAIRLQGLSKCYHLYDTPRDRLKQFVVPRLQTLTGYGAKQYFREFWALNNISLTVRRGETVGVIGRNGSGKSTLLQLICGTLSPTGGTVEVAGRIGALLELGAGFNPEFTGRENVTMNAAILGLSPDQIAERFEEILRFADIGEFIDQPVKTYSSGMFVRLAFAIVIHVEPDILIIDEALSVGDLAFQNKCILKIKELRDKGTTLLFVTHDLSTLQILCDRAVWLHRGELVTSGDPIVVSQEYYAAMIGTRSEADTLAAIIPQKETGMAKFIDVGIDGPGGAEKPVIKVGEALRFRFAVRAEKPLGRTVFAVSIFRADGDWVVGQTSLEADVLWPPRNAGAIQRGRLLLQPNCLAPGDYLAAFGAYSDDLSICYALSDLTVAFSVRWNFPTWGRFIHPAQWVPASSES